MAYRHVNLCTSSLTNTCLCQFLVAGGVCRVLLVSFYYSHSHTGISIRINLPVNTQKDACAQLFLLRNMINDYWYKPSNTNQGNGSSQTRHCTQRQSFQSRQSSQTGNGTGKKSSKTSLKPKKYDSSKSSRHSQQHETLDSAAEERDSATLGVARAPVEFVINSMGYKEWAQWVSSVPHFKYGGVYWVCCVDR